MATDDILSGWRHDRTKALVILLIFFLATLAISVLSCRYWFYVVAINETLKEQQQILTIVTDYTHDWEYWQGPGNEILYMSQSCERITGYTKEDFVANSSLIGEIVHPDDRQSVHQHLRDEHERVAPEGSLDFRIIKRDGDMRWMAHVCRAVYAPGGGFLGRRVANRDITERKLFEHKLRWFSAIVEYSYDVVISKTLSGLITSWNPAAERLFGYTAAEVIGKPVTTLFPPDRLEEELQFLSCTARGETVQRYETVRIHKNGSAVDVSVTLSPIVDSGGKIVGVSKIAHDITERKLLEQKIKKTTQELIESEARLTALFENMSSGVAIYKASPDGKSLFFLGVNKASERIENICRADVIGKNVADVFPGVEGVGLLEVFRRVAATGIPEHFPISLYRDGRIEGWRENFVYKLPSNEIVAIYDDVTERKRLELELERQAKTDYLTGLANRRYFMEQGAAEFSRLTRYGRELSVLAFDIDYFKKVNDAYGHTAGDMVIRKIAEVAHDLVREVDLVGRLGGEEFAMILPETKGEDALLVAERFRSAIEHTTVFFLDKPIQITVSIGVVSLYDGCENIETLLDSADQALYDAKRLGRNRVCVFDGAHPA